jgi:cell division protein FtsB
LDRVSPQELAAARRRRTARSENRRTLLLTFIACVLVVNALIGDRGLVALRHARRDRATAAASLQAVRDRNAALRREAERLKTDPRLIEAIARQELGLARRDERVVFVVNVK